MPPSPVWQPLSMLPQIARLIDDMAFGVAEQLRTLAQAAARPHLLDDATLDQVERVYGEQRDFLRVYDQQLARWREGKLTAAQEREIARLEQVLATLHIQVDDILARAQALRSGTIDAIQRLSDEELGRQTLLGAGSLGQAEDLLRAASGGGASGKVGRGKPKPGSAPTGSPAQERPPASSSGKGRAAPAPRPASASGGTPFALPPEVTVTREQQGWATVYTFTHTALSQLGQLIVQQVAPGQTQLSAEVSGDPADPQTEERRRVFLPIAKGISAALGGEALLDPAPLQPTPAGEEATIPSRLFECPHCGAPVGLLLFARGRALEDVARLMFPKLRELGVAAWVVGNEGAGGAADLLTVYPQREPIRRMRLPEFDRIIDALREAHCQRRPQR